MQGTPLSLQRASIQRAHRRPLRILAASAPRASQCRLAGSVLTVWQRHQQRHQHQQQQQQQQQQEQAEDHKGLLKQLKQGCSSMAALLPLASTSLSHTSTEAEIYYGLAKAIDMYLVVLTIRVLLSWFKFINWAKEPGNTLRQLTDPFLNVFRGIVPAVGGIDLSPMLGFFLLNFARNLLMQYSHVM